MLVTTVDSFVIIVVTIFFVVEYEVVVITNVFREVFVKSVCVAVEDFCEVVVLVTVSVETELP